MAFPTTDYADVRARAEELHLNRLEGLALLPRNFDTAAVRDELLHESAVRIYGVTPNITT
jgi:hypothetical protein